MPSPRWEPATAEFQRRGVEGTYFENATVKVRIDADIRLETHSIAQHSSSIHFDSHLSICSIGQQPPVQLQAEKTSNLGLPTFAFTVFLVKKRFPTIFQRFLRQLFRVARHHSEQHAREAGSGISSPSIVWATMEYSMDRYKSVWPAIKSAAPSGLDDAKLFPFIMAEAMADLQQLREYSLMDSSQQQFWLEQHIWNNICPNDAFPGDISLQKEIDQLRLSRQRRDREDKLKMTASVWEVTRDFKKLGEQDWLDPKHSCQSDSEDEGEIVDLESVQNQFDVGARSRGINPKPIPNEDLFDQLVLHMKRTEYQVDPLCTSEQFQEALKAAESIDADRTKYTVRFVFDQSIMDALHGCKSGREDIQFVEKELDVKLSCRIESTRKTEGEAREFVISARPGNIFEAVSERQRVHTKLRDAFHCLRRWQYLIGGDLIKKRWDISIELTTFRKAFVQYRKQKRDGNKVLKLRTSKPKKEAVESKEQQRPTADPITMEVNTCSSTRKRKRDLSPEPSNQVSKCLKLGSTIFSYFGFTTKTQKFVE